MPPGQKSALWATVLGFAVVAILALALSTARGPTAAHFKVLAQSVTKIVPGQAKRSLVPESKTGRMLSSHAVPLRREILGPSPSSNAAQRPHGHAPPAALGKLLAIDELTIPDSPDHTHTTRHGQWLLKGLMGGLMSLLVGASIALFKRSQKSASEEERWAMVQLQSNTGNSASSFNNRRKMRRTGPVQGPKKWEPPTTDDEVSDDQWSDFLAGKLPGSENMKPTNEGFVPRPGIDWGPQIGIGVHGGRMESIVDSLDYNRCLLVGVDRGRREDTDYAWAVGESLEELAALCDTAGLDVMWRTHQRMDKPNPATYIGSGKVKEIDRLIDVYHTGVIVFDDELSFAQQRNIQKVVGDAIRIVDRTQLILQIFQQRARTKEAQLQVELARAQYMLPRLKLFLTEGAGMELRGGGSGGQGGSGAFLKGAGESQIEMDRRLFRNQISRLQKQIDEIQAYRQNQRENRSKAELPVVALVGYTNAGKSTLLNTLCDKEVVYAEDKLFATLDPTTRQVALPGGRTVLFSDTVGFIQKLPTKLVNSFRATLEEVQDATILVHVVDVSSETAVKEITTITEILMDLDTGDTPQILVLNKMDLIGAESEWRVKHLIDLCSVKGGMRVTELSCETGEGLDALKEAVEKTLNNMDAKIDVVIPYSRGDITAQIHAAGTITLQEYEELGIHIEASVPVALKAKLEAALELEGPEYG